VAGLFWIGSLEGDKPGLRAPLARLASNCQSRFESCPIHLGQQSTKKEQQAMTYYNVLTAGGERLNDRPLDRETAIALAATAERIDDIETSVKEADSYYAVAWANGLISSRIAAGSVTEAYDAAKRFGKTWSSESRTDIEDDWGLSLTDVSRADCRAVLYRAGFEVAFDSGQDDDWVIWQRAK
jgi:hypothetical protein